MTFRATIVAVTLFASACSPPSAPPVADGSGDAALEAALKTYVVEFLRRNPTTNTYLGGAGFDPTLGGVDGTLRDYSPAAIEKEDVWLSGVAKTLDAIAPASLTPRLRIDREVALAQIHFMLREHRERRYQERALDTYVGEPFRALDWQVQGMTATGPDTYGTDQEWALVIKRVRTIPWYLDNARAQLEAGVKGLRIPDPRMLQRDGLATTEANAKYFSDTLPKLAAARLRAAQSAPLVVELIDAGRQAAAAYGNFRDFIKVTYFDGDAIKPAYAINRYVMGEQDYNWALANNFKISKTATQLFDESWPIVQATQATMVDLARRIGAAHHWTLPSDGPAAVRAVFDQLSKDYPKSDAEMIDWYRNAAFRLVDYARKTGLFDVPAEYKLDVVETPGPLQSSIDGAAYYPAPPFKNSGVGRFYVTPTHNDAAALQANNRAALADLPAHEGFPGHDWYYKVLASARDKVSPVRWLTPGAVEDSSSMWEDSMPAEGWGLYAEALMAEPSPGSPDGFYTPEEHLYQLQGQLLRDLRVRLDTGLHLGAISYENATTLFSEVVDFLPGPCAAGAAKTDAKRASCESAERAIFRYSKWPTQAITYRLGKDQIYALREEAAKLAGPTFSAKTFHLRFIQQGTIPSGYFRDELLNSFKQPQ